MALTVLFVSLLFMLVTGVPVAVALGGASLIYILMDGLPAITFIPQLSMWLPTLIYR